jgi:hypothetical protein
MSLDCLSEPLFGMGKGGEYLIKSGRHRFQAAIATGATDEEIAEWCGIPVSAATELRVEFAVWHWLGDRSVAIVVVNNLPIKVTKSKIVIAGISSIGEPLDYSPPDWLAGHIRKLLEEWKAKSISGV